MSIISIFVRPVYSIMALAFPLLSWVADSFNVNTYGLVGSLLKRELK
jgi:hypothetical protein